MPLRGATAGHLVWVDLDRTQTWALAEDQPARVNAPETDRWLRLLANLDPLNAGRGRELLVPDPAVRERMWTFLGGLWRPTKKGKKLLITVEPRGELMASAKDEDELAAEAERIAPFRGAESAELRMATL